VEYGVAWDKGAEAGDLDASMAKMGIDEAYHEHDTYGVSQDRFKTTV